MKVNVSFGCSNYSITFIISPLRSLKNQYLWAMKASPMKKLIHFAFSILISTAIISCDSGNKNGSPEAEKDQDKPAMVRKKRDDGTLSSINQVDEDGYVHGVKVNFYEDGKTIHSKVSYLHGRKHGPAIWYFKSGKIYEQTEFFQNRKHGLSRKYYESGVLFEEVSYNTGLELPGKKIYDKEGKLIPE